MLRKKPIILLLQPDTSEQAGGVTEAQCREVLQGTRVLPGPGGEKTYSERMQRLESEVH